MVVVFCQNDAAKVADQVAPLEARKSTWIECRHVVDVIQKLNKNKSVEKIA